MVAATAAALLTPTRPALGADPRPNVLVIVTDDQRRGIDTLAVMPRTRHWFQERGTDYVGAVATTSLCCPSRASLLSGRYAHNHGLRKNGDVEATLAFDQAGTFPRYLRNTGYRTALVGKYLNTWPLGTAPPSFEKFSFTKGGYLDPIFNRDGRRGKVQGYSTDLMSSFAAGYLREFEADDTRPWLLYIATQAPHSDYVPSPAYAAAPVPPWSGNPATSEADESDKPPSVRNIDQPLTEAQRVRRQQLRTLMSVDDLVEDVFATLAELGEIDSTLAIYTSDNGYMWGEYGIINKRFPYLPSVQVPLLVRWPGHVTAGHTDGRLVANVDVAPTILQAAGVTPSPSLPPLDGRSLLDGSARGAILLEYFRSPDAGLRSWRGLLTPTVLYTEWYEDDLVTRTFREYYDLVADPWQVHNLLGDSDAGNDPPVTSLAATLRAARLCVGAACWIPP